VEPGWIPIISTRDSLPDWLQNSAAGQGEEGVGKCLDIIARELDTSMALCGYTDIKAVDADILATRY
ncbi:hypothetical protein DF113_32130, partial [Burkholderia stagnalis]|uniref:alpha-hydroxy-acid oxidizing protein n=1 Tax=Burkholderia stagnalis TaxID=1503054 RepID=UPI000FA50B65